MRLSVVTLALVAIALVLGVLPGAQASSLAAQHDASSADQDAAAGGDAWTPGELNVDWASFAASHRATYEASDYAAAARDSDDEAAREALRDEVQARYLDSLGDRQSPQYDSLEPARTGALGHQYYDECDDGSNLPLNGQQAHRGLLFRGGEDGFSGVTYYPDNPDNPGYQDPPPKVDLRSMFIVQSTDDNGRFDQTGFLFYSCQPWALTDLGAGGVSFGLYVTPEDSSTEYPTVLGDPEAGPDFIVSIFPEHNVPGRPLQILAVRTPSRDASTWTLTFLDEAQRIDSYEADGVVPTSAIGDFTADDGFAWTIESVDTQGPPGGRDWFPERNFILTTGEGEDEVVGTHIPQFPVPEDCGVTGQNEVRYRLDPQATIPNDVAFPYQWSLSQMRMPDAWDTIRDSSLGGRSRPVTIAVVDTGIDSTRFDLLAPAARVVGGLDSVYGLELEGGNNAGTIGPFIGPNAVNYTTFGAAPPPRDSDRGPHGTAVASLIGAHGNNAEGIAGVDWGARLMPIRVNDVNQCITNDVVADGVKWAVDHGADIVNISLARAETLQAEGNLQAECNDGVDNDGDGASDDGDAGCSDDLDGSEGPAPGNPTIPEQAAACSDGRDNDGDRDIDFGSDVNCETPEDNQESTQTSLTRPAEPLECDDGVDNDADGFVDATNDDTAGTIADSGCEGADDGSEGGAPGSGVADDAPACADGRDNNDRDSLDDLNDPECLSAADDNEGAEAQEVNVDPLREAIDYALEQGVVVVAAAGNRGSSDDPVIYPAAYPGVIAVGATDRSGERAFYSGTGRWLSLVAPGGNNGGALSNDLAVLWEKDTIRAVAGTSFSTAFASGTASLYLGLNPHIARGFTPAPLPPDPGVNFPDAGYQRTVDDVKIALQNGVRDMAPEGHDIYHGWGRLDADRALDVDALGGPLVDPARVQLPRTNADSVIEIAEDLALSRPLVFPDFVVLTRSDVAVDALAAAGLLGRGSLLVSYTDGVSQSTLDTMHQLLPNGGTVYLLGGTTALSEGVQNQVAAEGFTVQRLAGATRIDTAIAIGEEVRRLNPGSTTVGLVRADGGSNPTAQWADALTGGAWAATTATPMLVTGSDALDSRVAEALTRWGTTETILFGGNAALSAAVQDSVPGARRIFGDDRASTAVAIAEQLWDAPNGYLLANGYFARGWAAGLAAAGLAADTNSPLLYTGASTVPAATVELLSQDCPDSETLQIIGGASLVTGTAETALLEAATC